MVTGGGIMPDEEVVRKAQRDSAAAAALAKQANGRLDELMQDLPQLITDAVEKAIANMPRPSEEEREFLSLAVKAQAQRVKLRQAVIEKTVPALIWSAMVGFGLLIKTMVEEYARNHGWKL